MTYSNIENIKNVIHIHWETWDKHCFHVSVTTTRKGIFGYLRRTTRKIAEIDYFPEDRTDEELKKHVINIIPLIKAYAKNYDAVIEWNSSLQHLIDDYDLMC